MVAGIFAMVCRMDALIPARPGPWSPGLAISRGTETDPARHGGAKPNRAGAPRPPRQHVSLAGILACGSLLCAAFPDGRPWGDRYPVAVPASGYPHTVAGAAAV